MSSFYVQEYGKWVNKSDFVNKMSAGVGLPVEVYGKKNGEWIRLDKDYIAKSTVVEGYCQWTASYYGNSPTDGSLNLRDYDAKKFSVFNGYNENRYWYGIISFKNLLAKVKGKNITKVEIRLRNTYAAYDTIPKLVVRGFTGSQTVMPTDPKLSKSFLLSNVYADVPFQKEATGNISLNASAISDIKNGRITGICLWADEWASNRYGYFEGGTSTAYRPYIKITYTENVWQ